MIELADEVVVGYAGKGGMLARLIAEVKGKKVIILNSERSCNEIKPVCGSSEGQP
jgi:hypothetical protein